MEENNSVSENKKKKYLPIAVVSILLLIPIVFIIVMLKGNDEPASDPVTGQQVPPADPPEQRLVTALKSVKTDSSAASLYNLGLAFIDNKMYKEGVSAFIKVIKLDPQNARVGNNLGFAYGCLGDWDNGIKYCQEALNLDPSFQLAKNNLKWMQDEKAKATKK